MRNLHRLALVALALTVAIALQSLPTPAQAQDEPIQARARDVYVDSMRQLADGYTYATALAGARGQLGIACPVPSSTFTSSFGAPRDGHLHQGVDMMADHGTTIVAPASGMFDGDGESFWLYAEGVDYFGTHNGGDLAPNGRVTRGQTISTVSNTGNASGGASHLHFEIHPDGGPAVDPFPIVAAACDDARTAPAVRTVPAEAFPRSLGGHRPPGNEVRFFCGQRRGARWVACIHRLEGHRQWRGGRGTPGHTFTAYRRQARAFRRYLAATSYPTCSGPSDCPGLVRRAAARYGVDPNAAESVAWCESTMSPTASNGGRYLGLFQQMASAWAGRASSRGFAGRSAFDPWANASVSMMMVREDGDWGQWECKP